MRFKLKFSRLFSLIRSNLLIALAALLVLYAGFIHPKTETQIQGDSTSIPSWEEVPEMEEILGDDQTKRLLAARRLVERVDVEAALEILENSPLAHDGEGHLAMHQIGFYAYQKYGFESILKCKDYFLYACYHGTIIEAASDQGFGGIVGMSEKCRGTAPRFFQCAHAVGHSLLAMWNYDLPNALKDCDKIYENEKEFPDAQSSCHNGAFMENLFGVHDWGTGEEAKRDWLSDDLYFPCNAFEEKYQKGCWLNQAARIYILKNGDIPETTKACEQIGNSQYSEWCIDNIARQIHPMAQGDIAKVLTLCEQTGVFWREFCIVVNAGAYYSVGDPETGISLCNQPLTASAKSDCYQRLIGQLIPDVNLNRDQKEKLCTKMEASFSEQCMGLVTY